MSLKSWKQEFYPITAWTAARRKLTPVQLVNHSLQKWTGLLAQNLSKHHMDTYVVYVQQMDDPSKDLEISAESCSLCQAYVLKTSECSGCPLFESRGKVRCDMQKSRESNSPFGVWIDESNPIPMIRALKKALRWAEQHETQ